MAANQSSPGVVIQERDLTTITSLATANVGVLAAPFELGPVEEVVQISSEKQLSEVFGEPNDYNFEYAMSMVKMVLFGIYCEAINMYYKIYVYIHIYC